MRELLRSMFRGNRPYSWLPALIIVMTVVALAIGLVALHYVETRLVAMTGESLALAAAEVADKLDRLLFERYGDVHMMAKAFGIQAHGSAYMTEYLTWMQKSYYPVYLWLGVTDARGIVVAATTPASVGQDHSKEPWFLNAQGGQIHVGDVEPYEVAGGVDSIAFTAPIVGPQGEFRGAVTTRVGLPPLEDVVTRTIHVFQEREGFLGTVEYQFLTRTGEAFVDSDLIHKGNVNLKRMGLPSARLSESPEPGYVEERHLRRAVDVVTGYARTQGRGDFFPLRWSVLVRVDRGDILAPIRRVLWRLVLAGALVWVPMFAVLLWATGRVRKEWAQAQLESERVREALAALGQSERRFRELATHMPIGVFQTDEKGDSVYVNPRWCELAGLASEEAAGAGWLRALHPDDLERVVSEWYRAVETGQGFASEYRFRTPEGKVTWLSGKAVALRNEAGTVTGYLGTVSDITARKQAENRQAAQLAISLVLAESGTLGEAAQRLLRAVCDTMGWELGAIWRVDRAANVLRCEHVWHLPSVQVKEFVAKSRAITFLPGIGLPGRVWASGAPAWIPDVVNDPNFPRAPVAARSGLHGAFGFPIKSSDATIGILEFFSHEIRQPDEGLLQMMADIGIKIGQFVERKQLEEQLRQSQKMEAIGQLAGGIAHDFNNVLTVITGYSQLLLFRVGADDPLRAELEEIRKAGDRAAALIKQMLAFSRRQVLAPKVLDLNEVLTDIQGMLRRLIGEDIEMVTVPGPSLGRIKADPGQIEQVIVNLAVNARDAMPQGGKLTIETANVVSDGTYAGKQVMIPPGLYVMLAVSDTGHGMDADTQLHIFEPFFTTKEKGKGTGLGLATVYGIVKQSDGYITVYSEPGRGATFKVYLPRVEEAVEPSVPSRVVVGSLDGSETILVIEDEDTIRALACKVLRSHGYRVLEARDADEALRLNQEQSGPIHLLLTDVVMPRTSGRELAERMAPERPEMKVLYMSGYTDDAVIRHGVLQEGTAFLQKPFTPVDLARKVREVLGGNKG